MARTAKETSHLRLRVEKPLLARLEKAAEKNGRTLTGEITHRLEVSFSREDMQQTAEELADILIARGALNVTVKEGDRVVVKRDGDQ